MFPLLPDNLKERIKNLQQQSGLQIVIKSVRNADPLLKGRIYRKKNTIFLEYNDVLPGFFWHLDVLEALLGQAEKGVFNFSLWE